MKKITKYVFSIVAVALVTVLFCSYKSPPKENKQGQPNVILILMDDMGYGDLECYGGTPYHTPNINKLAGEGMRFTNFAVAQATCSASRAALLTGCYPNRIGISGALSPDATIALNPEEETIPKRRLKNCVLLLLMFFQKFISNSPLLMPAIASFVV